jgi:UDP-N-acetyl-D-glucosamine dehydrogenase
MSYISSIASATIGNMVRSDNFKATSDFDALADIDAILICVPTPLGPTREPDLAPVVTATETIARHFKKGSLVVL